ncbi:MFS transporter [Pseudohaliea sp.]|uniref:MFS transporter n=1 Tax=Pseudohaliea sp. TaxID=2740289 RepID=UPI0032ED9C2A
MVDLGEFRSGWRPLVIAVLCISVGVAALPLYTAGIFMVGLEDAFGWSRTVISAGSFLFTIGVAMASPVVGTLAERFGVRAVLVCSLLAVAIGFYGISLLHGNKAWFLTLMFLTGFFGSGSSAVLLTKSVMPYFDQNRGLAFATVLAGAGMAAIWGPLLFERVISSGGVAHGYRLLAGGAMLAVPLALLAGRPTGATPEVKNGREFRFRAALACLADRKAIVLLIIAFLMALATIGPVVHLVPLLVDQGLARPDAAKVASALGLAVIISRLIMGLLLDRYSPPWISFTAVIGAATGVMMIGFGGTATAALGAVMLGFALGAEVDIFAYFVSRYFPGEAYGLIFGTVYALAITTSGVAPVVFSAIRDYSGGYDQSIAFCALCLSIAAALFAYGSKIYADE